MHGTRISTRTPRSPLDYYPTPAPVVAVLANWLTQRVRTDVYLDPAAGDGALISAAKVILGGCWHGIELHPERAIISGSVCADAISIDWPAANVIANPPFSALDEFWVKASQHRAKNAVWVAVLMPVAWWSAESRVDYDRPDHILQLGWRPCFKSKDGPAHKGSQDFIWAVLAPTPAALATWERVNHPEASSKTVRRRLRTKTR